MKLQEQNPFRGPTTGKVLSSKEINNLAMIAPLIKLSPQQNPLPWSENQLANEPDLSKRLKKNLLQQRQILRDEFCTYQNDQNFSFYFPESKFPPVAEGQQNLISYEKSHVNQVEDTYRDRLSPQQIEEIKVKGQFSVKSTKEWIKIPYVWQLNDMIFKGINRVQKDWYERLSVIHAFGHQTWKMLTKNLPEQLLRLVKFPYKLLCLFIGEKTIKVSYPIDYNREIAKDFWNEVMSGYYSQSKQWFSQLWIFLDTKLTGVQFLSLQFEKQKYHKTYELESKLRLQYDRRKKEQTDKINLIKMVSNKFDENWKKSSKKIFNQIQSQINKKYETSQIDIKKKENIYQKQQQILLKFSNQEFNQYTAFLTQQLPKNNIDLKTVQALVTLLTLVQVTIGKEKQYERKREKQKQKIQKQIRQKHPIMSQNWSWCRVKIQQQFQPLKPILKNQFFDTFLDENLEKKLNQKQIQLFKLWVEYVRNHEIKTQQKKQQKKDLYEPQRIFYLNYPLLPPYQIVKHEVNQKYSKDKFSYEMIRSRTQKVTTGHYGWKFSLFLKRIKTWTIGCFVALVYSCWLGEFGLRCLCGIEKFSEDQFVDSKTGELQHSYRKTVLGKFFDVLDGISKSRQQFQALPDTGLFGKTCSRICNLIECYIFRFFIVGILIILTLYPVAILMVSLISFFLIITLWAWMPMVVLMTYFFNIFVYQFDKKTEYVECYKRITPILRVFFIFLWSMMKAMFYIMAFFIITPLVSVAIFFYAIFCYCVRSISDTIVLCFIRCCGHTPNTDSFFATKISGSDMASQQFMSINEQDVYILVQSQLEQIHLELISQLTRKKLLEPYENFKNTYKILMKSILGNDQSSRSYDRLYYQTQNPIQKNGQQLLSKFYLDSINFAKRYPDRPRNVRFTNEQLNDYLFNSQQIVKNYIVKNHLVNWIFDKYNISVGDYDQLTRKIWVLVFQCGEQIFQPLQSIDKRFRLEDQYQDDSFSGLNYNKMRVNVTEIAKAIKGQSKLKPNKVMKLAPMNTNLYNQKLSVVCCHNIFELTMKNTNQSVHFDKKFPTFLFFPHLSIKQLTKFQQAQYAYQKDENAKNWKQW